MIDYFVQEFETKTSPCDRHWKHGDTLIKYRIEEPNIFWVKNIISLGNAFSLVRTIRFLCALADKYDVTLAGWANPAPVGPSVTKNETFFIGLNLDRLLQLYAKFGFVASELNGKTIVTRRSK
jgi:hypothetical protein